MRKTEVTFANIIASVRHRLSDQGVRIAEAPLPLNLVWWPRSPDITDQLMSDYGVLSGPKKLTEDFDAEVKAIHEALDEFGHAPGFASWQKTSNPAANVMYASLNQRDKALSVWEHIAFPVRRVGDFVFRLSAPREVLGGRPLVDALQVDEFIRGISVQAAQDKVDLARLQRQLKFWRLAAGLSVVVVILLVWHTLA